MAYTFLVKTLERSKLPKTCIICGERAGSGEHVFPAALGGRRTNRGIYCGPHNNKLGPLAAIISDQLKPINALLAVRPDHSDAAQPFDYTSPNGERLTIFDGSVAKANPAPQGDQTQMHIQLTLGGPSGLRAIAYVALTYLAHYFQEYARLSDLHPLKSFILGSLENEYVWWENEAILNILPANPFEFGHTIAITTSARTGDVSVIVSLFGSLTFGVAIAKLRQVPDRSVVVFLDPHADRPPQDIKEIRENAALFLLSKPYPLYAHLEKIVSEGFGQRTLQCLFARIERWKFRKDMSPVVGCLSEARTLSSINRHERIKRIVEQQTQRVYRLMQYVVNEFENTQTGQPGAEIILSFMKASITPDLSTATGLSDFAHTQVTASMIAVVEELDRALAQREVDVDFLWTLLSAGYGAWIVGEAMLAPLRTALEERQT